MKPPVPDSDSIVVGVSKCLLGEKTRYDGEAKPNVIVRELLGDFFTWQTVCPEVAAGMSVPRPPIQLVEIDNRLRALGVDDKNIDATKSLSRFSESYSNSMTQLSGFIFKSRSPSCGLSDTPIFRPEETKPARLGKGIFSNAITATHPLLPVIDERELEKPDLFRQFIRNVFCLNRWQHLCKQTSWQKQLAIFHSQHRHILILHNPAKTLEMENKLGIYTDKTINDKALKEDYIENFMTILKSPLEKGNWVNLFQVILSKIKEPLQPEVISHLENVTKNLIKGNIGVYASLEIFQEALANTETAKHSFLLNADTRETKIRQTNFFTQSVFVHFILLIR